MLEPVNALADDAKRIPDPANSSGHLNETRSREPIRDFHANSLEAGAEETASVGFSGATTYNLISVCTFTFASHHLTPAKQQALGSCSS